MRDRVVGDVAAIETDRFAIKEIGERLVARCRVTQTSGCKKDAADEVFVQLALQAEACANACTITVIHALLKEILAAHPHVAGEANSTQSGLQK